MSVSSFNNINILVGDYEMQINELINESGNVNEAQPMGFLSKLGNKVAAGTGNLINKTTGITPNFGAQAQGRLNVGGIANQAMAGYQKFLGQTGEQPTEDSLLAYLKKQGYPIDNAKQVIATATAVDEPAPDDVVPPTPQDTVEPDTAPAEEKPSVWSNARNPGVTGTSPAAVAPTATESIRKILNMLAEGPNDPLDMKLVAKAIQAAAQQHAGAQVRQAPVATATDEQPTPADLRNAAAPTSNEVDTQSNVTTTNAPAAGKRIGKRDGIEAVNNAVKTISAVRPRDRNSVVDYAQQQIDILKPATVNSNTTTPDVAAPELSVQQGGKASSN
jgi:hypothetical protein